MGWEPAETDDGVSDPEVCLWNGGRYTARAFVTVWDPDDGDAIGEPTVYVELTRIGDD